MTRRDVRGVVSSARRWWLGLIVVVGMVVGEAGAQPESEAELSGWSDGSDPSASDPAEAVVRTAKMTTVRAQALALYFERCDVGASDEAAVTAAGDWEGLISLGYTPEALRELADGIPEDCGHHSFLTVILAVESGLASSTSDAGVTEQEEAVAPTWTEEQERIYRDLAVNLFLGRCLVEWPYADRKAAWIDWDALIDQGYTPARIDELAQKLTRECDHRSFASAILGVERGAGVVEDAFVLQPWQRSLRGRIHEHQKGWMVPSAVFTGLGAALTYSAAARAFDGTEYSLYATLGGFGLHAISLVGVGSAELSLYYINYRIDFERDPRSLVDSLREQGLGFLILAMGGYTHTAIAFAGMLSGQGTVVSALIFALPLSFFATGVLHAAITHWAMADELERILDRDGAVVQRPDPMRPRITGVSPLGISGVW